MNIREREIYGAIPNTGRVERVLKLIKYLKDWHSLNEISAYLEINIRSVQRYINLLVQLGFTVEVAMSKKHSYRVTNLIEYFS